MKKVIVLLAVFTLAVAGFCYAACQKCGCTESCCTTTCAACKCPGPCTGECIQCKALNPVTETLEATKEFVGTVVEVGTLQEPGSSGLVNVTVADEAGKTEIFPIDQTIRVLDAGLNVVAMNQLKKGDKVSVEYKEEAGAKKPTAVKIAK